MKVEYIFLAVSFVTLIALTKEVPIEGSTLPPERDASHNEDEVDMSDGVKRVFLLDRFNHSRMLTVLTTLDYDEWHYTTKRPPLTLKDFPGRPGVASWREISPGKSSEDKRKSRKISPTAAGVSSGSQSFPSKYHYSQIIWVMFLLFCFCWT